MTSLALTARSAGVMAWRASSTCWRWPPPAASSARSTSERMAMIPSSWTARSAERDRARIDSVAGRPMIAFGHRPPIAAFGGSVARPGGGFVLCGARRCTPGPDPAVAPRRRSPRSVSSGWPGVRRREFRVRRPGRPLADQQRVRDVLPHDAADLRRPVLRDRLDRVRHAERGPRVGSADRHASRWPRWPIASSARHVAADVGGCVGLELMAFSRSPAMSVALRCWSRSASATRSI